MFRVDARGRWVIVALVACRSSSSVAVAKDAEPLDAPGIGEATASMPDALEASAAEVADDSGVRGGDEGGSGIDATGLASCHGPLDCAGGEVCCFELAALRAPATCIASTTCPAGQAELCGASGEEKCNTGECVDYQCIFRASSIELTFFACAVPSLATVSCGIVFPNEDAGDDGGS